MDMRITTQMLNESARKAGLPVNNTSLLNYINNKGQGNSLLDALNEKKEIAKNAVQKSNYENLEQQADGLTNSLYGVGYGNLLQTTSIDNAESFAKVLEKISEGGTGGKETKAIAQKTETDKGENVQNSIPMTMVSRNVPRIQVVNGMESLQVKKINPYVTVAYKKI